MRSLDIRARAIPLAAALAFGALSFMAGLPPARAWMVWCNNCSDIWGQSSQLAKEIETAINTAEQLRTQIQQYQNMLTQGLSLPDSMFGSITGDLQRLQSLYQQGQALAAGQTDFDQRFRRQFGQYDTYLRQSGKDPNYISNSYRQWNEQGSDAMRVAMRASGQNVSAIAAEDALLAQLVSRSQNAQGRMQAIQAGNEIAAQQVQQLQKLRLLMDAQIQSQSLWYAQQIERQGADDAFRQKFHSGTVQNSPGKAY